MKTIGNGALIFLVALLPNCASIGNLQTADTLGKGNLQVGLEPGIQVLPVPGTSSSLVYPHLDGAIRYGITDAIDIGARVGFSLLELQGKFLFTKPGAPGIAVSFAPIIGGIFAGAGSTSAGIFNLGLPVLIGFKHGNGNEFILGPRVQTNLFVGGTAAQFGLGLGLGVGYFARIGESFGLLPEVAFVAPIVNGTSLFTFQFKLGFLFGKGRRIESDLPPPPPPPLTPAPPPPLPENQPASL